MKELFTYSYHSDHKLSGSTNNLIFKFPPPATIKKTSKFSFRLANFVMAQTAGDYDAIAPIIEICFSFTSNYVYNSYNNNKLIMYHDTNHSGLITRLPEYIIDISGIQTFNISLFNPATDRLLLKDDGSMPGPYGIVFELIPIYE